jgi:squalene-hopene/tetraprenyl-beta-curcumene cyclase
MHPVSFQVRIDAAFSKALTALREQRTSQGYWVGELSTSALSTATAVMALHLVGNHEPLVARGLDWLVANQNADGGWGDTVKSFSNISTTMLCRAALYLTRSEASRRHTVDRAEAWLFPRHGNTPAQLAEAVRARYGKDRTFATPILTTCALAGLVDWSEVPPLPFELAALPQSWFRFVRLHVVSYALPALIAIGQCIDHHKKPRNPLTRLVRALSRGRALRVLERIQPTSGGYLEAIPLTSFVTLSLAACGLADHAVARNGIRFLTNAVLPDGSWAIDSNLSTWVTTLAVNALESAGQLHELSNSGQLSAWLLGQQYRERHPYTGSAPGAWAWTPLPGGVPDADDTPGALLALVHLKASPGSAAVENGVRWLLDLQNRDGGWPTFCRGWGHLPFDRSGADLTAHVLRALHACKGHCSAGWTRRRERASAAGLRYLAATQRPDGSWLPLWFGNQHVEGDENPAYGTARVLAAYRDLGMMNTAPAQRGVDWLLGAQNTDGGWGGAADAPSSIEETALALEILCDAGPAAAPALNKGLGWLVEQVEEGRLNDPAPIGFYFAKLWYCEKLYPIIFSVAALGRARQCRSLQADASLGSNA